MVDDGFRVVAGDGVGRFTINVDHRHTDAIGGKVLSDGPTKTPGTG
jgi:hypothetical protein